MEVFLIMVFIISLSDKEVEGMEFCANPGKVTTIFTLGNTTYIQKGDLFYTKQMNETFAGKTGVFPNKTGISHGKSSTDPYIKLIRLS